MLPVSSDRGPYYSIPGSLLYANGVYGEDLATLTEEILVKELRMTPFAARKVLRARHFGLGCDK